MAHHYTLDLSTKNFEIQISPTTNYGYFEHNELGDECGGGIWFEGKEITDYDGVFELPKEVEEALNKAGYAFEE